jgi:hypothetical protein
VNEEINKLGGVPRNAKKDSPEFEAIKREVAALPVVQKPKAAAASTSSGFPKPGTVKVEAPSQNYVAVDVGVATLKYPDNWKKYGKIGDMTLAPDGGVVDPGNGQPALAYGMIASVQQISSAPPAGQDPLKIATAKPIDQMQQENGDMRTTREPRPVTVNGEHALSTYLRNDSPAGGLETDWVVTVLRPEGLVYFVFIAPEPQFKNFSDAFSKILDSIQFKH